MEKLYNNLDNVIMSSEERIQYKGWFNPNKETKGKNKGKPFLEIPFKGSFKRNGKKRPFYGALPSSFSKPNGLIKQLFYNILSDILERGLISFC